MPTYRVIWEFNESNGSTFEEVFYIDATNAEQAAIVPTALQTARLALLHPLNLWVRVRVSNTQQQRDTFTQVENEAGTFKTLAGPLAVGATVICTLSAQGGGTRKLWLRGCALSVYTRDPVTGRDAPQPFLSKPLVELFKQYAAAKYGIRKLTPINSNPLSLYSKNPIVSVNGTTADGTSVITFKNPLVYPNGSRVVIAGANKKELPSLNGHFSVLNIGASTVTIPYRTPNDATIATGGGYIRQETYGGTNIFNADACGFAYFGTHTSKSPLSNSRGARRASRIRLSR
jgi:hypothetical protein